MPGQFIGTPLNMDEEYHVEDPIRPDGILRPQHVIEIYRVARKSIRTQSSLAKVGIGKVLPAGNDDDAVNVQGTGIDAFTTASGITSTEMWQWSAPGFRSRVLVTNTAHGAVKKLNIKGQ